MHSNRISKKQASSSLVPRLHSPAFYRTVYKSGALYIYTVRLKSWGVESGNEARLLLLFMSSGTGLEPSTGT